MHKKGNLDSDIDRLSSRKGKTNLEKMRRDKVSEHFDRTISSIKKKHLLIENEIKELIAKKQEEITLPLSIFNKKLGMLEAASLYLKDKLNLSFNEIAKLLKRDYKTIWTSYNKAKKKLKK